MAATESWLASSTAKLFLRLAIATISLMRWLYNYGLITNKATDRFFRWAKLLEQEADRLMAGKIRHD
jgi:hypothetical protein